MQVNPDQHTTQGLNSIANSLGVTVPERDDGKSPTKADIAAAINAHDDAPVTGAADTTGPTDATPADNPAGEGEQVGEPVTDGGAFTDDDDWPGGYDDSGTKNVSDDHAARDADGELCPFYCPGCGRGLKYEGECTGSNVAPHPAIQTVSTDELTGDDPDNHTPAPDSAAA